MTNSRLRSRCCHPGLEQWCGVCTVDRCGLIWKTWLQRNSSWPVRDTYVCAGLLIWWHLLRCFSTAQQALNISAAETPWPKLHGRPSSTSSFISHNNGNEWIIDNGTVASSSTQTGPYLTVLLWRKKFTFNISKFGGFFFLFIFSFFFLEKLRF